MIRRVTIAFVVSAIGVLGLSAAPSQAAGNSYRNTGACSCLEKSTDGGRTWVRWYVQ